MKSSVQRVNRHRFPVVARSDHSFVFVFLGPKGLVLGELFKEFVVDPGRVLPERVESAWRDLEPASPGFFQKLAET